MQTAVDMDVEDINAHLTRLDGVEMLEKLRKQVPAPSGGLIH